MQRDFSQPDSGEQVDYLINTGVPPLYHLGGAWEVTAPDGATS
jgi:hypothetical protein